MGGYEVVSRLDINETLQRRLVDVLERVCLEHRARAAFLVESCGRPLGVSHTLDNLDPDVLASLTAAAAAAAIRLGNLLGENDVTLVLQRDGSEVLQLTPANDLVLAVVFGQDAPQGLDRVRARLRQKRALKEIRDIFEALATPPQGGAPLADLNDAELESLLNPVPFE